MSFEDMLKQQMSSRSGRAFIWHLLNVESALFADPISDTDSMTQYNMGKQSVGRNIHNYLMSPMFLEEFSLMHRERNREFNKDGTIK